MAEKVVTNPYNTVKYSRHYVNQKLVYPVLQKDTIAPNKREALNATVKTLTSGKEVEELVWEKKGHEHGWMYKKLDVQGRIGLLMNNGIEVALFYERLITYEEPQPGAPPPVTELKHPEDTWMRLDLLKNSARQQNVFIKISHDRLGEENDLLKQRVSALEKQVSILETDLFKAGKLLDLRKAVIEKLQGTKTVQVKKKKSDWSKRFKVAQKKAAEQKAKGTKDAGKKKFSKNNRQKRHGKTHS